MRLTEIRNKFFKQNSYQYKTLFCLITIQIKYKCQQNLIISPLFLFIQSTKTLERYSPMKIEKQSPQDQLMNMNKHLIFEGETKLRFLFIISRNLWNEGFNDNYEDPSLIGTMIFFDRANDDRVSEYLKKKQYRFHVLSDIKNTMLILSNVDNLQSIFSIHVLKTNQLQDSDFLCQFQKIKKNKKGQLVKKYNNSIKQYQQEMKTKLNVDFQNGIQNIFPGWFNLQDKKQLTDYRTILWAFIQLILRLPLLKEDQTMQKQLIQSQINQGIKNFKNFIKRLYPKTNSQSQKKEQKNKKDFFHAVLKLYSIKINHVQFNLKSEEEMQSNLLKMQSNLLKIIGFYKSDSFFHNVINTKLRIDMSASDFKDVSLPFSELYCAIKYFYDKFVTKNNFQVPQFTKLYHGTQFPGIDQAAVGQIIQLRGMISTSKNQQIAKGFMKNALLVFHLPKRTVLQKNLKYDHGFLDLTTDEILNNEQFKNIMQQIRSSSNSYNYKVSKKSDDSTFSNEQQVLINALNVFRITSIQRKQKQEHIIHLEFVFLCDQQKFSISNISEIERPRQNKFQEIIINFNYFKSQIDNFKDLGDLYRHFHEFDKQRQFYKNKMRNNNSKQIKFKFIQSSIQSGQLKDSLAEAENIIQNIEIEQPDFYKRDSHLKSLLQKIVYKSEELYLSQQILLKQFNHLKQSQGQQCINLVKSLFQKIKYIQNFEINSKLGRYKEILEFCQCKLQDQLRFLMGKKWFCKFCFFNLIKIFSTNNEIQFLKSCLQQLIKITEALVDIHREMDLKEQNIQSQKLKKYLKDYQKLNPLENMDINVLTVKAKFQCQSSKSLQIQLIIAKQLEKEQKENPSSPRMISLISNLSQIKEKQVYQSLTAPSSSFTKKGDQKPQQLQQALSQYKFNSSIMFDQKAFSQKIKEVEQLFLKKIDVYKKAGQKTNENQILRERKKLAEFFMNVDKLIKSQQQLSIVIQQANKNNKKCMSTAQAYYLIARNHFYRGNYSKVHQNLQKARSNLQQVKLKSKEQKYEDAYKDSDLYFEIKLLQIQSKNYCQSLDAFKKVITQISELQQIVQKKVSNLNSSITNLIKVYTLKTNLLSVSHKLKKIPKNQISSSKIFLSIQKGYFDDFKKQRNYLRKQKGEKTMDQALSYCREVDFSLQKLSRSINNPKKFENRINQAIHQFEQNLQRVSGLLRIAMQISSAYPYNHPKIWFFFKQIFEMKKIQSQINCLKPKPKEMQSQMRSQQKLCYESQSNQISLDKKTLKILEHSMQLMQSRFQTAYSIYLFNIALYGQLLIKYYPQFKEKGLTKLQDVLKLFNQDKLFKQQLEKKDDNQKKAFYNDLIKRVNEYKQKIETNPRKLQSNIKLQPIRR